MPPKYNQKRLIITWNKSKCVNMYVIIVQGFFSNTIMFDETPKVCCRKKTLSSEDILKNRNKIVAIRWMQKNTIILKDIILVNGSLFNMSLIKSNF